MPQRGYLFIAECYHTYQSPGGVTDVNSDIGRPAGVRNPTNDH
jgi:hypothetical protein